MSIGSTHIISVILSLSAFFILATFSSKKYLGLHSLKILTYSKNNHDFSPSSHLPFDFAVDKS